MTSDVVLPQIRRAPNVEDVVEPSKRLLVEEVNEQQERDDDVCLEAWKCIEYSDSYHRVVSGVETRRGPGWVERKRKQTDRCAVQGRFSLLFPCSGLGPINCVLQREGEFFFSKAIGHGDDALLQLQLQMQNSRGCRLEARRVGEDQAGIVSQVRGQLKLRVRTVSKYLGIWKRCSPVLCT